MIFVEVSEWDDIVWFIIFQVVSGLVRDNVISTFEFNAV